MLFIASVHFLQCSTKETEMQSDGNRRNMFGYMPDLAEYFTSYNRLMNQGNLNDRRPLAVRRDMNSKTDKRVLADIMKPIMGVMGPFGGVFNGFKNETRRETIKKTTTQGGNLNQSAKQKQRCHATCPRSDSPICVTNFKNTAEFPNVCEYRKQTRCFQQLVGKFPTSAEKYETSFLRFRLGNSEPRPMSKKQQTASLYCEKSWR